MESSNILSKNILYIRDMMTLGQALRWLFEDNVYHSIFLIGLKTSYVVGLNKQNN